MLDMGVTTDWVNYVKLTNGPNIINPQEFQVSKLSIFSNLFF